MYDVPSHIPQYLVCMNVMRHGIRAAYFMFSLICGRMWMWWCQREKKRTSRSEVLKAWKTQLKMCWWENDVHVHETNNCEQDGWLWMAVTSDWGRWDWRTWLKATWYGLIALWTWKVKMRSAWETWNSGSARGSKVLGDNQDWDRRRTICWSQSRDIKKFICWCGLTLAHTAEGEGVELKFEDEEERRREYGLLSVWWWSVRVWK